MGLQVLPRSVVKRATHPRRYRSFGANRKRTPLENKYRCLNPFEHHSSERHCHALSISEVASNSGWGQEK